jgi:hypothetical protein
MYESFLFDNTSYQIGEKCKLVAAAHKSTCQDDLFNWMGLFWGLNLVKRS